MLTMPHDKVYTRIKKSKIHGIGVFAIIDIPKSTFIFKNDESKIIWYDESILNISSLPAALQQLYEDFCVFKTIKGIKKIGCPSSFNNMPISWFLNSSKKPNAAMDKNYNIYVLHNIKAGTQLLLDYDSFSEKREYL